MHPNDDSDQSDQKIDIFNAYLWKNRELLGEPTDAKVYNFPYQNLADLKGTVPDKVAFHLTKNPNGVLIIIKVPSGKLYYDMCDDYGEMTK